MSAQHPGFKAVAAKIAAREGYSGARAARILAASSRNASETAKRKNPRLRRVKGKPKKHRPMSKVLAGDRFAK